MVFSLSCIKMYLVLQNVSIQIITYKYKMIHLTYKNDQILLSQEKKFNTKCFNILYKTLNFLILNHENYIRCLNKYEIMNIHLYM